MSDEDEDQDSFIDHEKTMSVIEGILMEENPPEEDLVYPKRKYFRNIDMYYKQLINYKSIVDIVVNMFKVLKKGHIILYSGEQRANFMFDDIQTRYPKYKSRVFKYIEVDEKQRIKITRSFSHQKKPSLLITTDNLGTCRFSSVKMVFCDGINVSYNKFEDNKIFLKRVYKIRPNPKGIFVIFYDECFEDRVMEKSDNFYFVYNELDTSTFEQRVRKTFPKHVLRNIPIYKRTY